MEAGDALEMGVAGEDGVAVLQGEGGDEEVRQWEGYALGTESGGEATSMGPRRTGELQVGQALEGTIDTVAVAGGPSAGGELRKDHAAEVGLGAVNQGADHLPKALIPAPNVVYPDRRINDNARDALQL